MNDAIFTIRRADWQRDREALRSVREQVFVQEQRVPVELEWDDADEQALHLLAQDAAGRPIATARLLADGHIGRMAVLRPFRGRGVGGALLRELLRIIASRGLPTPFLDAQITALPFYLRFGFEPEGAEFMDAGIAHRRMVLARPGAAS